MASVTEAVRSRISTRAFLPDALPLSTVREILEIALRAPSGGNTQPWHLYVVSGKVRISVTWTRLNEHSPIVRMHVHI